MLDVMGPAYFDGTGSVCHTQRRRANLLIRENPELEIAASKALHLECLQYKAPSLDCPIKAHGFFTGEVIGMMASLGHCRQAWRDCNTVALRLR
jgi:hypothetical protein